MVIICRLFPFLFFEIKMKITFRFKRNLLIFAMLIITIGLVSCAKETLNENQKEDGMPEKPIEIVLKEHTDALMAIEGVVGVGQGLCNDKDCIKVFVVEKTAELEQKIPDELDGFPVEIVESGEFKARQIK